MQGSAFGNTTSCLWERSLVLSNCAVILSATIMEVDNGPGKAILLYKLGVVHVHVCWSEGLFWREGACAMACV